MKRANYFVSNVIKFILGIAMLYAVMYLASLDNYVSYFISVLIVSLPIIAYSMMKVGVGKASRLIGMIKPKRGQRHVGSFYYNYTRRKTLTYIIYSIVGIFFGFTIPVFLLSLKTMDLLILIGIVVLAFFVKVFIYSRNPIYDCEHEIKNQILRMRLFDGIVLILGSVVFGLLSYFLKNYTLPFEITGNISYETNKIAKLIALFFEDIDVINASILNNEASQTIARPLYMIIYMLVLQCGVLFYGVIHFLHAFTFRFSDVKKCFMKVEDIVDSYKHGNQDIKYFHSDIPFFICVFVVLMGASIFSSYYTLDKKGYGQKIAEELNLVCESISGSLYAIGTSEEIKGIVGEVFYGETKEKLKNDITVYFDSMYPKIDSYLDWFYSMGREYLETGTMLADLFTGNITEEDNFTSKMIERGMEKHLLPEYDLQKDLDDTLIYGMRELEEKVAEVKERNIISRDLRDRNRVMVVVDTTFDDIYRETNPTSTIKPSTKLLTSAGVGVLVFAASKAPYLISKHLAKKASIKMAAMATKEAIGETAEKATKEVVGEAAEKVAKEVAGEAAEKAVKKGVKKGASKGIGKILVQGLSKFAGVAALGIGVAVDYGMVKLDEVINREKSEVAIKAAIEEEKKMYLDTIEEYFTTEKL